MPSKTKKLTQAELALAENDPPRTRHALEQIQTSARRCSRLVTQLLAFARNEPGAHPASGFITLDLALLSRKCALGSVPVALERRQDLGFEGPEDGLFIKGDVVSLTEMIANLLENALLYTPEGGIITLRVGREGARIALVVEDSGPGIAPEERERVFELFYQTPDTGQQGSGLGLSIVREVVEMHGARIELSDGPDGQGLRVQVSFLPLG